MPERTTVRLPPELLDRAKRKAAEEGRTVTSLVEEGLRRVVSERRRKPARRRKMPRVSAASGGLRPGIDLADGSALQEFDDLAFAASLGR